MLVTPEDFDRLARLEIDREGDHDVVWACKLARKLSQLKPTEAEFPEHALLINQNSMMAYTVRHAETLLLEQSVEVWKGSRFWHKLVCDKVEGLLFIRPYVRLESPKFPEFISELERVARFTVYADKTVLATGALAEILIGLDGYGVRRKPYIFKLPPNPPGNIFGAGPYQGETGNTFPPDIGVFLMDGTDVEVALHLPDLIHGHSGKFSIGFVVARYTTKSKHIEGMPPPPLLNS